MIVPALGLIAFLVCLCWNTYEEEYDKTAFIDPSDPAENYGSLGATGSRVAPGVGADDKGKMELAAMHNDKQDGGVGKLAPDNLVNPEGAGTIN